ncbi:hypothetical protein TKK_0012631 [Trichogramma kaykai]
MRTYSFGILSANGTWLPRSWDSRWIITLYSFYTIFQMIVYYLFMISEILDIVWVAENVQQISENMVQLVNVVNVSQKILTMIFRRKRILDFMDLFEDEICAPSTPIEKAIQKKTDDQSCANSRRLFCLYTTSVCMVVYMPFFINPVEAHVLAYRGWRPYVIDTNWKYYLSYLHQSWAVTIAATTNGAIETLMMGFMMMICAQFEIIEERFKRLPDALNKFRAEGADEEQLRLREKQLIVKLVKNHLRLYELTQLFNDIFFFIILSQFIASISVLCVTTLSLALTKNFKDFLTIFLYILCMLLQIFIYTWYGNEITIRNSDLGNKIFLIDWRSLTPQGHKFLLMIALRTTKPIVLSAGHVITLSNLAFTSICKSSYSVYNVLTV